MSADLLRRAAKALREAALDATPGPWEHVDFASPNGQPFTGDGQPSTYMGCGSVITWGHGVEAGPICAPDGDLYPRSGYNPDGDMRYIALTDPNVGYAVAQWLDAAAEVVEGNDQFDGLDLDAIDGTYRGAVSTARAILREAP